MSCEGWPLHLILDRADHVAKIRQMRNEWNTQGRSDAAAMPASPLFLYICASIAEHSNLDELAETDDSVRAGLQKICAAVSFRIWARVVLIPLATVL